MKQIRFDIIGEYEWSKLHGEKSKHPQERLKELGIKEIISIPESIADCWICLVEDFDFELPNYITVHNIYWEYFYHYCPDACRDAMIKCGIDYKSIEDKCKTEEQKEQERINRNKKLFDEFTIKSVREVTAYDKNDNALFVITIETFNPHAFTEGRLYWMMCISPIEYTGVFLCTEVTDEEAIFITIVCTSGTAPSAKNRFYICNENYQNFIRVEPMCTLVGLDWNTGTEEIRICVDDFGMRNKSNNNGVVRVNNKINLTKG